MFRQESRPIVGKPISPYSESTKSVAKQCQIVSGWTVSPVRDHIHLKPKYNIWGVGGWDKREKEVVEAVGLAKASAT